VNPVGDYVASLHDYDHAIEVAHSNHGLRGGEFEDNTLFECTTIIGNIQYFNYCGNGKCVDGGQGNSDYCQDD
jgi:hypothetical protein